MEGGREKLNNKRKRGKRETEEMEGWEEDGGMREMEGWQNRKDKRMEEQERWKKEMKG